MSQSLAGMQAEIAHIASIYPCLSRKTKEPPVRKQITQFSDPTTSYARPPTARHLITLMGKALFYSTSLSLFDAYINERSKTMAFFYLKYDGY